MENQDMPSADAETEVSSEKAQATQVMTQIREQIMDSNKLTEEQLKNADEYSTRAKIEQQHYDEFYGKMVQ